ncbi:MAG: hypothetical protein ACK40R_00230 [Thermomonas sp.]
MTGLAMIRNHVALLRLARIRGRHWEAARAVPMDNVQRSRAQSLLAGLTYQDGSTNPGPLTLAQAQDVLAWANTRRL